MPKPPFMAIVALLLAAAALVQGQVVLHEEPSSPSAFATIITPDPDYKPLM